MTWAEKLSLIAEWLIDEALQRSAHRRSRRDGFWEFTVTNPEGRRLRDTAESHISEELGRISLLPAAEARVVWKDHNQKQQRRTHAQIAIYHRRNSLNLTLRSTDNCPPVEIPIVVYFGRRSGRRPSRAKNRDTRAALRRIKSSGNLQGEVLCVDALSRRHDIVEQLAVFLGRRGIYDGSVQNLWKTFENSLPIDFIDPHDARSYPAWKRVLRVANHARCAEAKKLGMGDTVEGVDDWRRTDDSQPKLRSRVGALAGHEVFSVSEAAELTGIPRRTLYDRINRGNLPVERRSRFIKITRVTFDGLQAEASTENRTLKVLIQDVEERGRFIAFVAEKRRISHASARRHIGRLLARKSRELLHLWHEFQAVPPRQ